MFAFVVPSGPRPFALMFWQPCHAKMDDRLFQRCNKVAEVYRWLNGCSAVRIPRAILHRYKAWGGADRANLQRGGRTEELTKELADLDEIVRHGKETIGESLGMRPSETMRVAEPRANSAERFADVGDKAKRRYEHQSEVFVRPMLAALADEQRAPVAISPRRAMAGSNNGE